MLLGRVISPLAIAIALLLWTPRPRGQTSGAVYFVSLDGNDANPGTYEQPWRHMEWAMARPFLRGGDTIRIRGGVYRPQIESSPSRNSVTDDTLIRPVTSGEPGRPITVMAEPGENVVLTGRLVANAWEPAPGRPGIYYHEYSSPSMFPFDHPFQVGGLYRVSTLDALDREDSCFVDEAARRIYVRLSGNQPPGPIEYAVAITGIEFRDDVKYWRLTGLTLAGFRTSGIIIARGAGEIELDRMEIRTIGAQRPGADLTNGYALAVYDTFGGNYIHHSRFHRTLAEAVHVSQTGAGGDLYENNVVGPTGGPEWFHEGHGRRLTGPGMILRGNRVTVRGNTFDWAGYHGLILESDLRGSEGAANPSYNRIEGNVFSNSFGNGIHADGKNGRAASAGNVIRFNLFERNNRARLGDADGELRLAGNFDDTLVANNTFYAEHANAVLVHGSRVPDGGAQGADALPDRLRLINNIAVYSGRGRGFALRVFDAGSDLVADYNDWHRSTPGPLMSWNGADVATFEEFYNRIGLERRGMSADPRFVPSWDHRFWLRAISPVIGRGLVTEGTSADLGAFPYRQLLALSANELHFATLVGREPPPQALEVRSAGGGRLAWSAIVNAPGWLRMARLNGETPSAAVISARSASLPAGVYSAAIEIRPDIDGEPPIRVAVTLSVLPGPPRRR